MEKKNILRACQMGKIAATLCCQTLNLAQAMGAKISQIIGFEA